MTRTQACLLVALFSTGCASAPVAPPAASWAIERLAPEPAAVVPQAPELARAVVTTPAAAAPVAVAAATSSGGGSGGGGSAPAVAPAPTPKLKIDLRGFLANFQAPGHRRLLATVADIAKLVLTVQQAGHPDLTATLTQADLAGGVADYSFANLPDGNAIVFVIAYDAAGVPIGSAAQVVVISSTQAAVADMTVQLVPATPASAPGGTLVTHATFLDGAPATMPASGTVLAEAKVLGIPENLSAGADGTVYVSTTHPLQQSTNLNFNNEVWVAHLGGDAAVLAELKTYSGNAVRIAYAGGMLWYSNHGFGVKLADTPTLAAGSGQDVAIDAHGNAYVSDLSSGAISWRAPDGTYTNTPMTGFAPMAVSPLGDVWTAWHDDTRVNKTLKRYAADGTLAGTYAIPGTIGRLAVAPTGELWVSHLAANYTSSTFGALVMFPALVKLAPDGTMIASYAVNSHRFTFDAQGNVWVAGDGLTKLAPDGTQLAHYALGDCLAVAVDSVGFVWVSAQTADHGWVIRKIQP